MIQKRMFMLVIAHILLIGIPFSKLAFSQNSPPSTSFENLSFLDVSFEQKNSFIDDVQISEIRLESKGGASIVAVDRIGAIPLRIAFLVDLSSSQKDAFPDTSKFYAEIIKSLPLRAIDAACLVTFDLEVTAKQNFTSDKVLLLKGIKSLLVAGPSRLYDAIYLASNLLGNSKDFRKVIVVFTDGRDTTSQMNANIAYKKAIANNIRIYMFGMPEFFWEFSEEGRDNEKYVKKTAGKFYSYKILKKGLDQFAKVVDEMSHLERIYFMPGGNFDPEIKISVSRKSTKINYPTPLK